MKIFYYSSTGNCEKVAEYISKKEKNEAIKIKTRKDKYKPRFSVFISSLFKWNIKLLEDHSKLLEKEKEIYIITPIWAGQISSPVRTFLNKYNFSNKEITLITVQADPDKISGKKVLDEMEEIAKKTNGKIKNKYALSGNYYMNPKLNVDLEKEVEEQLYWRKNEKKK